jgi:hypothetical protein
MHLITDTALDFIEGRLDKDQEAFWRRHMEVCNRCANDVLQWKQVGIGLKRSHLSGAPEHELENVRQIFSSARQEQEQPSALRTLIATIVFDSVLQPAIAGVRGASAAAARQVVMRAEEFDIHIKVWGEQDRRQMLGQLLPRNGKDFVQSARFHLLHNGAKLESTTNDELGEFHFMEVPEGDLSLQIDLPHLTVIGALTIKERL